MNSDYDAERLDLRISFGQNLAHIYTQKFISAIQKITFSEVRAIFTGLCSLDLSNAKKFSLLENVIQIPVSSLSGRKEVPLWFMFSRNVESDVFTELLELTNHNNISFADFVTCYAKLHKHVFNSDQYVLSRKSGGLSHYAQPQIKLENAFMHNTHIMLTDENCKELYDMEYIEKTILSRVLDYIMSQNCTEK